jgi:hypothetical protein
MDEIYLVNKMHSYQRSPLGISTPTNFSHNVHVGFDQNSGVFTGLPKEWKNLLQSSKITQEDLAKNPQAVWDVLEFYSENLAPKPEPVSLSRSRADTDPYPLNNRLTHMRKDIRAPAGQDDRTSSMRPAQSTMDLAVRYMCALFYFRIWIKTFPCLTDLECLYLYPTLHHHPFRDPFLPRPTKTSYHQLDPFLLPLKSR